MPLDHEQKVAVRAAVAARYAKVADRPGRGFKYPTGVAGMAGLGYGQGLISELPSGVADFFCGVGNPFSLGPLGFGQTILDVGCGVGVDTLVAAGMVGEQGLAVGLDPSPDMLGRARENLAAAGAERAVLVRADAEDIPLADASVDVVISNGAMNLVVDKDLALAGIWRVLRPGGALRVADQILVREPDACPLDPVLTWLR